MSAQSWLQNDEELLNNYDKVKAQQYLTLVSDEELATTVEALEKFNYKVVVTENKEDALAALIAELPEGASIYSAGSTTLEEIGFVDYAKEATQWDNVKTRMFAESDPVKQEAIRGEGNTADFWISSVPAITQAGEYTVVDWTGTRVSGFLTAKRLVIVASTNKIVPTYQDAVVRTEEFALPIESARVRVAYGVPESGISNFLAVKGPNPMGAPRTTVILVKEQVGF